MMVSSINVINVTQNLPLMEVSRDIKCQFIRVSNEHQCEKQFIIGDKIFLKIG